MIQEVRDISDTPGTNFTTDTMITRWLNLGLRKVYEMAYAADPDAYNLKDGSITTAQGTPDYTLPTDFWHMKKVSCATGSEKWPIRKMDIGGKSTFYVNQGRPLRWHFYDRTKIRLYPTPDGVYTISLLYVPCFSPLADAAETFDGINGWEEFGIAEAAMKCRVRDEGEIGEFRMIMEMVRDQIAEMAKERDHGEGDSIEDVKHGSRSELSEEYLLL